MTAVDERMRDLLRQAPPAELDAQLERFHQLRRHGVELHEAQRAAFGRAEGDVLLARRSRKGLWHVPMRCRVWARNKFGHVYGEAPCGGGVMSYSLTWVPRDAALDLFEIKNADPTVLPPPADLYGRRNKHMGKRACADCFRVAVNEASYRSRRHGQKLEGQLWLILVAKTKELGQLGREYRDVRCLLGEHQGWQPDGRRPDRIECTRCWEVLS